VVEADQLAGARHDLRGQHAFDLSERVVDGAGEHVQGVLHQRWLLRLVIQVAAIRSGRPGAGSSPPLLARWTVRSEQPASAASLDRDDSEPSTRAREASCRPDDITIVCARTAFSLSRSSWTWGATGLP